MLVWIRGMKASLFGFCLFTLIMKIFKHTYVKVCRAQGLPPWTHHPISTTVIHMLLYLLHLSSSYHRTSTPLLSSTYSFVPAHVALTVLPSDQSQASASSLSEEGLARIKDEVQWQSQKHFWGEVLFLDIYKSAEMCAILNVLCVGRGRWRCISQREMWFRGGEKATKF